MTSKCRTVLVRILVAVDHKGDWVSHGNSGSTDADAKEWICIDDLELGQIYSWIEATIPLPDEPTIEGVVTADGGE